MTQTTTTTTAAAAGTKGIDGRAYCSKRRLACAEDNTVLREPHVVCLMGWIREQ